ncbi:2'-5' RNA ligase family protein [Alkalicella caledoniensis]|uniref:2'-5' RNA ligase family protein n=2 Tax=Alkalicella caledoniensis TaxID=2731377 RepID=A0A7G9W6F1_ALKCA|nr:2'-5' RNA ligase family protein [Alkalicella caledoniensis]
MLRRCIMIFPQFSNMDVINKIRQKYDPLSNHVRPHITLVFPFLSNIEYIELKEHLEDTLASLDPFTLKLKDITPVKSFGNYLFLNICEGKSELTEIHNKLYTGILEEHHPQWLKVGSFYPHLTVGKIDNAEKYKFAIEETGAITDEFKTIVNRICVEIIDDNEDSLIEMEIELKGGI